ncbi:phage tail protein [Rhizobium skierniewicense]|uniref:phage tail protein n=1 Tax=Rhizobium skierniewicense TaxID=984260 RepID=UPI001FAC8208|nr:phage tail protein [Rhizobium skierniewicense]MCI9865803.1 phage tail protein [Rhizobium skierniewicense]
MTTPYVTGTVSVTAGSAVVAGTGTGWQTSGLVAGQFGVDGLSVPVLSIDSNTKITLAQPWPGATASGKAYWISYDTTPGQQTVANAMRLAEYIARLDKPALAALASLVPAADKLPYFGAGGAGALADFNSAARALLAGGVLPEAQFPGRLKGSLPFTNDMNLSTATGFVYGGGTTLNNPVPPYSFVGYVQAVNPLYFVQRVIVLGELSNGRNMEYVRECSNGVFTQWFRVRSTQFELDSLYKPERGSNANGQYIRFADGTQICWADRKFTGDDSTIRYIALWTFPAAFAPSFRPVVSHTVNQNTLIDAGNNTTQRTAIFAPSLLNLNSTGVELNMTTGIAWSNYTSVVTHAMAMGRWY